MKRYTEEQSQIITCRSKRIAVKAYAGCGKTYTLTGVAEAYPNERFLYFAFNKSIQLEAARKFPRNVKAVTFHGLAYPSHGAQFRDKLGNVKPYQISRALGLSAREGAMVLNLLNAYMQSADDTINEYHALAAKVPDESVGDAIDEARKAWAIITDPSNKTILCPHDAYLKLYQLSRPVISGIDRILLDEAQDTNPVSLAIVEAQNCGKIYVGDQYQSIYTFRGAVDAFDRVDVDAELYLTQSFRFGAGIAGLASALLMDWRDAKRPVQGFGPHQTSYSVDRNKPHAVIARTNGGLFDEAVQALYSEQPFGYVGGVDTARFQSLLDTYRLFAGRRTTIVDPQIKSFQNFGAMKSYAESMDDFELGALVKVVDKYRGDIPSLVDRIQTEAKPTLDGDEIALMTAHKSKGLEFDSVVLVDDFVELKQRPDQKTGRLKVPDNEQIHVLYVALTRALKNIQLNASIMDWLRESGKLGLLKGAALTPVAEAAHPRAAEPKTASAKDSLRMLSDKVRQGASLDEAERTMVADLLDWMAKQNLEKAA